jgi:hypothetical protein
MEITKMIPNRNKVEQPSVGSFTLEHEHAQQQVVTALQVSGSTVIVAGDQQGLMAYYVARMLEQLSALEGGVAPKIRKLPADRDGILNALNQRLADIELANVAAGSASDKYRAREVWVYESLTSFKADGVCFGAKIIRQFKAAGISLMISATPGETNAEALKKLMHTCKAHRWDFATPTQEQCDEAMLQAAHSDSFGAVQGAIRDMGMMANLPNPSEVLDFPKTEKTEPSLDSDMDVRQLLKAQRKQNKQQQVRQEAPTQNVLPAPRKRLALFQLAAGIAFIGLVVVTQFDMAPALFGGEATSMEDSTPVFEAASVTAASEVGSSVDSVAPAALTLEPAIQLGNASTDSETSASAAVATITDLPATNDQELMQIFAPAQPLTTTVAAQGDDPKESVNDQTRAVVSAPETTKAPVAEEAQQTVQPAPVKPKGIYVQHGSFARLQGALIWQGNFADGRKTKVFIKGKNPKRFVVVSGPFADRQRARNTLDNGSDAFLVPARLVGEEVMSLGGL